MVADRADRVATQLIPASAEARAALLAPDEAPPSLRMAEVISFEDEAQHEARSPVHVLRRFLPARTNIDGHTWTVYRFSGIASFPDGTVGTVYFVGAADYRPWPHLTRARS